MVQMFWKALTVLNGVNPFLPSNNAEEEQLNRVPLLLNRKVQFSLVRGVEKRRMETVPFFLNKS